MVMVSNGSVEGGFGLGGEGAGGGLLRPGLWATLGLALASEDAGRLDWTSRRGNSMRLGLAKGRLTVRESLCIPGPDNSWMTNP